MQFKIADKLARMVIIEITDNGRYYTDSEYKIAVNGKIVTTSKKVVTSIYNLTPDTEYVIEVIDGDVTTKETIKTDYEFVTLNVKDFGAKGDGVNNDTTYIQTAILACPKNSRVLIPAGKYNITSIFLKDDVNIELAKGAELKALTDRKLFPILPGIIQSYDETDEYNLGTWEGNPIDMFAGIITGINVKNVRIYGEGTVDGCASKENWWNNPKVKNIAFRPRQIYLNHCENITVSGITVKNSPSWNLHPYFSKNLKFIDLQILNPADSPNTDGLDPESCDNVLILGVYFSLGDDCIAVKSGKIYMGAKHKTPCSNITIRQSCMRDGHGAITIGSEMAGGVNNLVVKDCLFMNTDRGLRIKTRRGRGKDAIIDGIVFENLTMDNVMTSFVINSFYYCDPDGHTEYVRTKEELPVDERTPEIKTLEFRNIKATNCHVAAAFMYGLPEQKIEKVVFDNVDISFTETPVSGVPAMMEGVGEMTKAGLFANNIKTLEINNLTIEGNEGEKEMIANVDHLIRK